MAGFDISKYAQTLPNSSGPPRDIETITGEIIQLKQDAGNAILGIGDRLIEAKSLLSHGEWLPWLTERVEFSERTAQRFIRLAKEWRNPTALSDLGTAKALALLALPPEERDQFMAENHIVDGEEKTVIDMTSRELEKAIRERDEARMAAEQAQADTRAAQEAKRSMEESLKTANDLLSRAEEEKQTASAHVSDLERKLEELRSAPVDVAVMEVDQEKLNAARAEGAAAKAQEIAELKAQLERAWEARKKANEKRKNAEAAVDTLKLQLAEAAKASTKASVSSDPDAAKFEVYFNQAQEVVNKLRGLLLKARGREDQAAAEKLTRALLALSEAVKGAAQ